MYLGKNIQNLYVSNYLLLETCCSSRSEPQIPTESLVPSVTLSMRSSSITLPPWEEIIPIAELYLLYCDSQPLPLFYRDSFISTLPTREAELLFAILALAFRFSYTHHSRADSTSLINGYAEVARGLVMKRVSEGPVELSTLQCLCILSLVDFTSMNLAFPTFKLELIISPRRQYTSVQYSQQLSDESCTMCQYRPRAPFVDQYHSSRRTQTLLLEYMSSQTTTRRRLPNPRHTPIRRPSISPKPDTTSTPLSGSINRRNTAK